ncbi:hypothetical protein B0H10DRAFT_1967607 [Mycena sp. CBHHK59/15]|nr:hypothetical protein B0H10DRAFT_1967607 [Mycena sp. CBHHK59/15]
MLQTPDRFKSDSPSFLFLPPISPRPMSTPSSGHGPCSQCANRECVAYSSMGGTGGDCFCGHPPVAHAICPALPPWGGCVESGCPAFTVTIFHSSAPGRTLCERIDCGRPYISHLATGQWHNQSSNTDVELGNPACNPDHWPDHVLPVQTHTCFDSVDLPLLGPAALLEQPVPEDDTCTDFDLYLYMMYRPITRFAEFGGLPPLSLLVYK